MCDPQMPVISAALYVLVCACIRDIFIFCVGFCVHVSVYLLFAHVTTQHMLNFVHYLVNQHPCSTLLILVYLFIRFGIIVFVVY